jgi:hypothetical protein
MVSDAVRAYYASLGEGEWAPISYMSERNRRASLDHSVQQAIFLWTLWNELAG